MSQTILELGQRASLTPFLLACREKVINNFQLSETLVNQLMEEMLEESYLSKMTLQPYNREYLLLQGPKEFLEEISSKLTSLGGKKTEMGWILPLSHEREVQRLLLTPRKKTEVTGVEVYLRTGSLPELIECAHQQGFHIYQTYSFLKDPRNPSEVSIVIGCPDRELESEEEFGHRFDQFLDCLTQKGVECGRDILLGSNESTFQVDLRLDLPDQIADRARLLFPAEMVPNFLGWVGYVAWKWQVSDLDDYQEKELTEIISAIRERLTQTRVNTPSGSLEQDIIRLFNDLEDSDEVMKIWFETWAKIFLVKEEKEETQQDEQHEGPLILYFDGGARGNPGPGGYGTHFVEPDGKTYGLYGYLGRVTNNLAEYQGLLSGLKFLEEREDRRELQIFGDSKLVVEHLLGRWRVKAPGLKPLFAEVKRLLSLRKWSIQHVRREMNREADALANRAMDTKQTGRV